MNDTKPLSEEPEYVPFGKEWKEEVNKLPKKDIIDMLSYASRRRQEAEALIRNFVARVDAGEIRSKNTYEKFKKFLLER